MWLFRRDWSFARAMKFCTGLPIVQYFLSPRFFWSSLVNIQFYIGDGLEEGITYSLVESVEEVECDRVKEELVVSYSRWLVLLLEDLVVVDRELQVVSTVSIVGVCQIYDQCECYSQRRLQKQFLGVYASLKRPVIFYYIIVMYYCIIN